MKFFSVCMGILFWCVSAAAINSPQSNKKTVYWLFFELPGAVNLTVQSEPPGYIMEIYYLLKDKMPQYTHQVVEVPFHRSLQQMKKKKGACSLMILKSPERDRFMYFGTSYMAPMPAGVIAARDSEKVLKYVKNSKIEDLDKMLTDKNLQFGSVADRFYGKKISGSLEKHVSSRVLMRQGSLADRELRNLLKLGRIDIYFGYPFEAAGNPKAQFYFVKGNHELLEPRIGCEKTPFGEEVIAATEQVRIKHKLDKEFSLIHERFYPKSMQEEFRRMSKGL